MVKLNLAKVMTAVRSRLFPRPISLVVKAPACRAGDRQFKSGIGRKYMINYIYGGKDE